MEHILTWAEMGGYAPYVWGGWGLALVVVVALLVQSFFHRRKLRTITESLGLSSTPSKGHRG